jgi:hypothetical protein
MGRSCYIVASVSVAASIPSRGWRAIPVGCAWRLRGNSENGCVGSSTFMVAGARFFTAAQQVAEKN